MIQSSNVHHDVNELWLRLHLLIYNCCLNLNSRKQKTSTIAISMSLYKSFAALKAFVSHKRVLTAWPFTINHLIACQIQRFDLTNLVKLFEEVY